MSAVVNNLRNALALCVVGVLSSSALNGDCNDCKKRNVLYGEWPILGQNYSNTQVNDHEYVIDTQNVGSLVEEWNLQLAGPGVSSQPSYADGKIYFADSLGTVHAANAKTGAIIWQTNVPNNVFVTTPTITKDIIYIASSSSLFTTGNCAAMAFDRATGQLLWSSPLYSSGEFAGDYPGNVTVVENLVIVSISSFLFDNKFQGHVMAFDRFTGDVVWRVNTTSNQFLPNPEFGPAAGSFSTGAADLERRIYFIGTGQTFAGVGSPLANSLLAIDYQKGELLWSFQFETGDVWQPSTPTATRPAGTFDLDVAVPPNLFTVKVDGQTIDCVGVGSKGGKYKIFNRDQKNPHGVQPLAALQLDPGSSVGTIQGTPVVNDGILFIASVAIQGQYRTSNDNVYIPVTDPVDPNFYNLLNQASMKTMALDLKKLIKIGNTDGTIPAEAVIWTVYSQGVQGRNPLTFANGVLYQTSETGFLRALDPANGNQLFYTIVDPQPVRPGILNAGVTIANKRLYMSYGYDPLGFGGVTGGIKAYHVNQP